MAYTTGTVAYGTTGIKPTITCTDIATGTTFQPDEVELIVGGWYGGGDTQVHLSVGGGGSPTKQGVEAVFSDGTNMESYTDNTNSIYLMEYNGTNVVGQVVGKINSFVATGFTLNMIAADSAYNIRFKARKY